jgi:hydroxymethylbilane synthase
MPIGAHAEMAGGDISLTAVVLSLDGARAIRAESRGPMTKPCQVGIAAAEDLRSQGAEEILAEVQRVHAAVEGIQP